MPIRYLFLLLPLLLVACKDGNAYLAITWVNMPQAYTDNNDSIPSPVYNGQYYRTGTGSYQFQYTAWNGSGWMGQYDIYRDENFLFISGDDRYFELALYSFGPSFYDWGTYRSSEQAIQPNPSSCAFDFEVYQLVCTETVTQGAYTATLTYWPLTQPSLNNKTLVEE